MSNIKELSKNCISFNIYFNDHKTVYNTITQHIKEELIDMDEDEREEHKEIFQKCIELDSYVYIQAYPRTPVGFIYVIHYDLDEAIKEAINLCKNYENL